MRRIPKTMTARNVGGTLQTGFNAIYAVDGIIGTAYPRQDQKLNLWKSMNALIIKPALRKASP